MLKQLSSYPLGFLVLESFHLAITFVLVHLSLGINPTFLQKHNFARLLCFLKKQLSQATLIVFTTVFINFINFRHKYGEKDERRLDHSFTVIKVRHELKIMTQVLIFLIYFDTHRFCL